MAYSVGARRSVLALPALLVLLAAGWAQADEDLMPSSLTDAQKANVRKFLAAVEKPTELLIPRAKLTGFPAKKPEAQTKVEIKEYLTALVPHRSVNGAAEPRLAEAYWYRTSSEKGQPGVTVKRVVDLSTGEEAEVPEVLFNYDTPLAAVERAEAVKLARAQSAKAKDLFARFGADKVSVSPLVYIVNYETPFAAPGDRVATLQLQDPDREEFISVVVNLTRQSVREIN